jgi:hypothetical protein
MGNMQPPTPDGAVNEPLTPQRRTELMEALAQLRQDQALRTATLRASITCTVMFLLLGKLGLLLAMTLGLVAGGIVFIAAKAAQERKILTPIAGYSDQVLVACLGDAITDKQSLGERAKSAFAIGLMILIALMVSVLFANRA